MLPLIVMIGSGAAPPQAAPPPVNLQLDVVLNGRPVNQIGSFVQLPDRRIGATRAELESLGLRPDHRAAADALVLLQDIPTLAYTYDEPAQRISITVADAYLQPHVLDLHARPGAGIGRAQAGWGAVLNYDLFSALNAQQRSLLTDFNGTSLSLDARAFSPYGTLSQSAIVGSGIAGSSNERESVVRLNSAYRYSDADRLITVTAGDTISGGLSWTRPIRIGGLQAQRDFALRPDLITTPLPNLGGTAAVPSTVDVYVNNAKTYSQDIGAGPFSITNIPAVSGAGDAQVVLRDSAGHQIVTSIPFYGSPMLLAPGLDSWSAEAGLPRLSYGSTADTYVGEPVGSASWRHGLLDWLTLEAHGEAGGGVANSGVGAVVRTGAIGVASLAAAGSLLGAATGGLAALSYETRLYGVSINLASQHSFGTYEDLASATAQTQAAGLSSLAAPISGSLILPGSTSNLAVTRQQIITSARPPVALDRITLGGRFSFDSAANWSTSFVHEQDASNNESRLFSLSYSRSLPYNTALFATAYKDTAPGGSAGFVVGLSVALGASTSAAGNLSSAPSGLISTFQASRSLAAEPGSVGWQVQDSEGAAVYRQAQASYRSSVMTVQAGVDQSATTRGGTFEASGAVVGMGGDIFFSDRINDAFAVVDAGAPGVTVSSENRVVGTTDSRGMLLVPTLRSYQVNRISIDPANLAVDAEVETTREVVTPADRAGTLVPIRVHYDSAAALVVFVRPDGSFPPAGAKGHDAAGNGFIVGYDGQAFVKNLAAHNEVDIELDSAACHAAFDFTAHPGEQVRVGPVTCQ